MHHFPSDQSGPATEAQLRYLEQLLGEPVTEPLTKRQASALIDRLKVEKALAPATPQQRRLLIQHCAWRQGMSRLEAAVPFWPGLATSPAGVKTPPAPPKPGEPVVQLLVENVKTTPLARARQALGPPPPPPPGAPGPPFPPLPPWPPEALSSWPPPGVPPEPPS